MISAKTSTTTSIDVTKREEGEERMGSENVNTNMKMMKYCTDCKTTKTPLWRGGPSGPKSLCNACGIRYRKKRISTMPMKLNRKREKITAALATATSSSTSATTMGDNKVTFYGNKNLGELMVILGKDLLVQNSIVKKQRCQRRRKMGEEELAAVSLMALSCGVVFA